MSEFEIERCLSCNAPIIRAVGESGKGNPINPEPVKNGNVRLIAREGQKPLAIYDRKDRQPSLDDDGVRYVSHFSDCPDAPRWRRK